MPWSSGLASHCVRAGMASAAGSARRGPGPTRATVVDMTPSYRPARLHHRHRGGAPGASPTLAAVRATAPPGDRLPESLGPVAVLVPVKSFRKAKLRLAPALDGPERAALARAMAERVLHATGGLPCAVVCDDPEGAARALAQRAGPGRPPRPGPHPPARARGAPAAAARGGPGTVAPR